MVLGAAKQFQSGTVFVVSPALVCEGEERIEEGERRGNEGRGD